MNNSLLETISVELESIVSKHLSELRAGVLADISTSGRVPPEIIRDVNRLNTICADGAKDNTTTSQYHEVCVCLNHVEAFLKLLNQPIDSSLLNTHIYDVLTRARRWCDQVAARKSDLDLDVVWDFIDPVKPDHLDKVGTGLFEAKWWKPIPLMDVEILRRTASVLIHNEMVNPTELPGGMIVRFSILAETP